MARQIRIQFPGALYHVTARGDRREPIFTDEHDRNMFLDVLGETAARFNNSILSYCLMGNHYHLVMLTREANLSASMRRLNGLYTQRYNRRHSTCGHVFQGRFHANLIARDAYLIEACRYIELNPVRARLVDFPHEWKWSSYRARAGLSGAPSWLAVAVDEPAIPPELSALQYARTVAQARV